MISCYSSGGSFHGIKSGLADQAIMTSKKRLPAPGWSGVKEVKNTHKTFAGNTEGVRPVGGPRPRSGNVLKLICTLRLENVTWIDLVQHRVHWQALCFATMNLWFP
jgi:hypothetical protein